MDNKQDAGDAWFQERFGRVDPSNATPARHTLWYAGSLLVAFALLISFYVVLDQSMSRAHQHWARASQGKDIGRSEACLAGRSRDGCATGGVETVGLRGSNAAALNVTGR